MRKMKHTPTVLGSVASLALLSGCASTEESESANTDLVQTKAPVELTNVPVAVSDDWQLVWEDQFEGDTISKRNWSFETNCWGGGNNEQQCYTDRSKNAFVKDGMLHIVAHKERFTGPDNPEAKPGLTSRSLIPLPDFAPKESEIRNTADLKYEPNYQVDKARGLQFGCYPLKTNTAHGLHLVR